VQVEDRLAPRSLVEVIDILRDDIDAVVVLQLGQREMRGVRLGANHFAPPHVVEIEHEGGIARQCPRSANILDAMPGPKAIAITKSFQARLSRDSCPSEDNDVHGHHFE